MIKFCDSLISSKCIAPIGLVFIGFFYSASGLSASPATVEYEWSACMPHSVDGALELHALAKECHFAVQFKHDGCANSEDLVQKLQSKLNPKPSIHYPKLIWNGLVIPGYQNTVQLRKLVKCKAGSGDIN